MSVAKCAIILDFNINNNKLCAKYLLCSRLRHLEFKLKTPGKSIELTFTQVPFFYRNGTVENIPQTKDQKKTITIN